LVHSSRVEEPSLYGTTEYAVDYSGNSLWNNRASETISVVTCVLAGNQNIV